MSVKRNSMNKGASGSDWEIVLDDHFDLLLAPEKALRWYGKLDKQCGGLGKGELAEAIEWGSYLDRDKFDGKPKLRELRSWVFKLRKDKQRERVQSHQAGRQCEYCHLGWVDVRLDWQIVKVPCVCPQGQALLATTFPERMHNDLTTQAELGVAQAKERKAAAERLYMGQTGPVQRDAE